VAPGLKKAELDNSATRLMKLYGVIPSAPNTSLPLPSTATVRQFITSRTGLDYVPSTMLGRMLQKGIEYGAASALGGPEGIIPGVLSGEGTQGAKELGLPESVQGIASIAAPFVGGGIGALSRTLMRPTTTAGRMAAAADILAQSSGGKVPAMETAPITGAPLTTGQASNDPGILALEKARLQSSPALQRDYAEMQKQGQAATVNALQGSVGWPSRGNAFKEQGRASEDMHQAATDAKASAKTTETNAWEGLDPTRETAFDTAPLKSAKDAYVANLEKARRKFLPSDDVALIDELGPTEPLAEIQALRSSLTTRARDLRTAANNNAANAVEGLAKVVGNYADNLPMPAGLAPDYARARDITDSLHKTYDVPATQRALEGVPSAAGAQWMRNPESFDAYYKAVNGDPAAVQHARDYFVSGLAGSAESKAGDVPNLLSASYSDYVNKRRWALDDPRLFTPEQRGIINDAAKQLDMMTRTASSGMKAGSPTMALLSSNQVAQALAGKSGAAFARLITGAKTAAGAFLGHHFGGTAGMMLGGLLGHGGGVPYAQAAEAVLNLVDRAVKDSAFATDLYRYRQAPSPKTMTPTVRNLFAPMANPVSKAVAPAPPP
jgi:hypothetical protein